MDTITSDKAEKLTRSKSAPANKDIRGGYVEIDGEIFYRIENFHQMPPFFMSLVSSYDHWMFIASNGALTAGRVNPDNALFPYETVDKLMDTPETAGSKTIIRYKEIDEVFVWEPFSYRGTKPYSLSRNIYKSSLGNKVLFEEINHDIGLAFSYSWSFGNRFGFIRKAELRNIENVTRKVELLDGIQNILPYGVDEMFQKRLSNLADAYKKSELLVPGNIGIYYLSSIPTDKAEPSEGLKASVICHQGLEKPTNLLSSTQHYAFRISGEIRGESDLRARRGAYLLSREITLEAGDKQQWSIAGDINQDSCDIVALQEWLNSGADITAELLDDCQQCASRLLRLISSADGMQASENKLAALRHQSNVMFNIMRGGIPLHDYDILLQDFSKTLNHFNRDAWERNKSFLKSEKDKTRLHKWLDKILSTGDKDLIRISLEYLPLTFSRRHGDPSRPWNTFSIDLQNCDGTDKLSYQGNWRDIFQNWEALALSFPEFTESMVCRFLNATTADGYNPYKITKQGYEWEVPAPDEPWSNIGYWGDHQIIYLLKLLEWSRKFHPGKLDSWLNADYFTFAQVPYRIRGYDDLLKDPQDTIVYDEQMAETIAERVSRLGTDGKCLHDAVGICRAGLAEKLLIPLLSKMSNFIPDGGIWMNTQRPEWNDANNALVGSGISMVTLYYLRRYLSFLEDWFSNVELEAFLLSPEVKGMLEGIHDILARHSSILDETVSGEDRKAVVDALGSAGETFREAVYEKGLSREKVQCKVTACLEFFRLCLRYIDASIDANRRDDGLYHSYNLIVLESANSLQVKHLYEMLEGQVAVLSSGCLSPEDALKVLDALRNSSMYREDQQSYTLYPNRDLPRFTEKNNVPEQEVNGSPLLQRLLSDGNDSIIKRDIRGGFHFNGDFRNVSDLRESLIQLDASYAQLLHEEAAQLEDLFIHTFNHHAFTGRSGTFFGFEGLGSIYWHMVSKLVLAIQENYYSALEKNADQQVLLRLRNHYRETRDGIGINKNPALYGAFPTDPYSHTPEHAGAQQPGMTGQVKEDIISRFGELGMIHREGRIIFDPALFENEEILTSDTDFNFYDLCGHHAVIPLRKGSFAFLLCQVPVIFEKGTSSKCIVSYSDGSLSRHDTTELSKEETHELYQRTGRINRIHVTFKED